MVVFRNSPFSALSFIQLIMTLDVLTTQGVTIHIEGLVLPMLFQELFILPASSQVSLLLM